MKRIFAIVFAVLTIATAVSAQTRSLQEMKQITAQKLQALHGDAAMSRGTHVDSDVEVLMQAPMYTILGSSDRGFVIMSNDRRLRPVLAYSGQSIDVSNLPCGLNWWLNAVSEAMTKQLTSGGRTEASAPRHEAKKRIEPMLTSKWNQSDPFNKKCPEVNGSLPPAGCVATALSQLLYFHKYPESCEGEGYYTLGDGARQYPVTLNSTYDWTLLDDSYISSFFLSEEKKMAVAQLLFDCGAAVHMNYDTSGSGAVLSRAGTALSHNFRCDSLSVRALEREYFDTDEWMQIIRTELEAERPVIYGGQDASEGGHAFVLHGIDEDDLVYVNWGWGGKGDCWTSIDLLTPDGETSSFISGQDMVVGLRKTPEPAASEKYQSRWAAHTPETMSLNVFKRLQISSFTAFNVHHLTFYGTMGVYFEKTDGSERILLPYIETGKDVDPVQSGSGYNFSDKSFYLTELSVGTYYAYMASKAIQEDTPQPLRQVGGKINVYTITINEDRSVTIDQKEELSEVPTTTAIKSVVTTEQPDIHYFDLQGRQVNSPMRGIYIQNGKKVVME